ncbi:ATP synthase F1 subunit delta [Ruminococcus sp. OA3]|uniref:ATP synthase F1 subunit delta n=1 Tax=Ruminococcus sp. OA3 TaxID=2914164 RepID=UPI001F067D97|nr:ATP synthase F1 subunit delta [Ruminococcus sp. OA3]MCH1983936.1 ATP synthase F1 subunit delta [Ruminococcus sp. OA3]
MTQTAINYARVLFDLAIPGDEIAQTEELLDKEPLILKALKSPVVQMKEKYRVIDRIFPAELHSFLKVICSNDRVDDLQEIFREYRKYVHTQNRTVDAVIECVTPPAEAQEEKICAFLKKKYHAKQVVLEKIGKPELIGGFVLRVNDEEYDWSLKGRLQQLEQKLTRR